METKNALFFLPWTVFLALLLRRVLKYSPTSECPFPGAVLLFISCSLAGFALFHHQLEKTLAAGINRLSASLPQRTGLSTYLECLLLILEPPALTIPAVWLSGFLKTESQLGTTIVLTSLLAALTILLHLGQNGVHHDSLLVRFSIATALILAVPWYMGMWHVILGKAEELWLNWAFERFEKRSRRWVPPFGGDW